MADNEVKPVDDTIAAKFELPPDLAARYKKPIIVFPIPRSTPVDQRAAVASKMYEDWAMNEMSTIPPEQTPSVEKIGILPAMYEGLKKSAGDIYAGGKQLLYAAQKTNPLITGSSAQENAPIDQKIEALRKEQAAKNAAYEEIRKQRPIAAPTGEMLPYLVTRSPAIVGAAEALKYGDPGERAVRGVLGGVSTGIGNIVGGGAAKYVNPALAPATRTAIKNVSTMGINPRLSELTGSRTLAGLEDVVMQNPFGGALEEAQRANQTAYNRVTARSIGMDADHLGDDVLAEASNRIGKVYDTVAQLPVDAAPIRFTPAIEQAADKIIHKAAVADRMHQTGVVDPQLLKTAQAWRDMVLNGDFISGSEYAVTRENLSNLAWDAEGSAKIDYRNMLNALDDAAELSLKHVGQGELANNLKIARAQYSNLKTIEKGNVVSNGDVNIKLLRNAVRQGRESAYKEGRFNNDLGKLAKYSEATAPIAEGSATAKRGFYQSAIEAPYMGALMAVPNALLANTLASPLAKFIPKHLAGTKLGAILGTSLERGAKIPSIEASNDLIMRRLYGPFTDESTAEPQGGLSQLSK